MTAYERLGGEAGVNALMDGLYVRALADPLLSSFLAGVDIDRLKSRQLAFVSQATGGPHQYVGSLPQAHARLRIEQRHFDAFVQHMREALQDLGTDTALVSELYSNGGSGSSTYRQRPLYKDHLDVVKMRWSASAIFHRWLFTNYDGQRPAAGI
jgi:hemoglobin